MAEGYVGVKFKTLFEGTDFGYEDERKTIVKELSRLREDNLLDRNNGNISVRVNDGMVITPTGKDMSGIGAEDMILVRGVNEKNRVVRIVGKTPPSSEAMMHWLIYEKFPRVKAVVHFHKEGLLESAGRFIETEKEHPYGTPELAHAAVKALKEKKLVVLKNHGGLAVSTSLSACHNKIRKAVKSLE